MAFVDVEIKLPLFFVAIGSVDIHEFQILITIMGFTTAKHIQRIIGIMNSVFYIAFV